MIPTSEDLERHPFLGAVLIISALTLLASMVAVGAQVLVGQPLDLGFELDWEKIVPVIIKFAAEALIAAFSVFRLLKPIEARLAVVEAKLDLLGTGDGLHDVLEGRDEA